MRFVHTADWQIGMRAARVGAVADRVREERFAAARRVVDLARHSAAEFLLVAGDTFENNAVERVAVQRVADVLGSFSGPVFVIPGNHDPPVAGSVWDHPSWKEQPRVRIFREPAVVELPGGVLFACPLREKHSPADPTAWINAQAAGDGVRIGLAHGTIEGVADEPKDHPIALDACRTRNLDYLALGHWHSTSLLAECRIAYAGTHETTKFGERDSGNALVVEISAPGAMPRIEAHRTGGLNWLALERSITRSDDLASILREIDEIDDPASTLLDVCLRGVVSAADNPWLTRIDETIRARCLWGRLDVAGLCPAPGDDGWLAELPNGPVREAAARLSALAAEAQSSDRPDGDSAVLARQALRELYALAREVGP